MKRIVIILVSALLVTGTFASCSNSVKDKKEKSSKDSTKKKKDKADAPQWDFYLLGSWIYNIEDGSSEYTTGVETFLGDGTYQLNAEKANGEKAVMTGTWALDEKENFTVNVKIDKIVTPNGEETVSKSLKYVIVSLEPGALLNYQVDGKPRTAGFIYQK